MEKSRVKAAENVIYAKKLSFVTNVSTVVLSVLRTKICSGKSVSSLVKYVNKKISFVRGVVASNVRNVIRFRA